MQVSLTVGKVDAGVTVLLTPDKRLIEFPSILLPPNISSGSIVDIDVSRNFDVETKIEDDFTSLQSRIFEMFGVEEPSSPVLRCRNATQTSVVLEWDTIQVASAKLLSLSLYRNDQRIGVIPNPHHMHTTKISGLGVDTQYYFHLVLKTTAGTYTSNKLAVRTHKMTDLSGVTITLGSLSDSVREMVLSAVDRIGAKIVDTVRIDTTHFITTDPRGAAWEKAVASKVPIVRPEWIETCEKTGRIASAAAFYLESNGSSSHSSFAPSDSRSQHRVHFVRPSTASIPQISPMTERGDNVPSQSSSSQSPAISPRASMNKSLPEEPVSPLSDTTKSEAVSDVRAVESPTSTQEEEESSNGQKVEEVTEEPLSDHLDDTTSSKDTDPQSAIENVTEKPADDDDQEKGDKSASSDKSPPTPTRAESTSSFQDVAL